MTPLIPSRELIESKAIVEGPFYDFKEEIDLDSERGKARFIDDVIAFLNTGPGHLILGVKEKRGAYETYRPIREDPHKFSERIQSIAQSNIDPIPRGIECHPIPLNEGCLLDIRITEHRMQPYQNKITGGFYIRTDKQNAIIPRDEIYSHFKRHEDYRSDLRRLSKDTARDLQDRRIMQDDGPILTISILPREHYEDHPPFKDREGASVLLGPAFDGSWPPYRPCGGGLEAIDASAGLALSRFYISSDWFIQATVAHPFWLQTDGRVGFHEMKPRLTSFLKHVAQLIRTANVRGPYLVSFEFSYLKRNENVAWIFHTDAPVTYAPRVLLEQFDPEALANGAYDAIIDASRYR
jgi:hypothetical protein